MLESTVWRQYHKENDFREKLAEFCVLESVDLLEEDKELYGAMKAKMTKRELKLFAMDCADKSDEELKNEFDYSDDELAKAKFKLYKKLKQDKTRLAFKQGSRTVYQ